MRVKNVASKTPGRTVIVVQMTESEFHNYRDESSGICLGCGEIADGVEPDARKYDCESCGESRVYGLEEVLLMNRLEIVDNSDDDENEDNDEESLTSVEI